MAIVIYPDGTMTDFVYKGVEDANRLVGGLIDCVALGSEVGYLAIVNDEGLLLNMALNTKAEMLTGYGPLAGPCVVVSFEEAGEDELLGEVNKNAKAAFEAKLLKLRGERASLN